MLEILTIRIKKNIGDLYEHFVEQDFLPQVPGVFTHYFATMFSYNISLDYANRVIDYFWLENENVFYDCLIHLLKLKKNYLMTLCMEVNIKH